MQKSPFRGFSVIMDMMMGIENWFNFRSEKQRQQDREDYLNLIFPYGEKQKEKITLLLKELFPERKAEMRMFHYLSVRQLLSEHQDEDIEKILQKTIRTLKKTMNRKEYDDIYSYLALALVDIKIDEKLVYPDFKEIIEKAEELKKITQ